MRKKGQAVQPFAYLPMDPNMLNKRYVCFFAERGEERRGEEGRRKEGRKEEEGRKKEDGKREKGRKKGGIEVNGGSPLQRCNLSILSLSLFDW